MAMYMLDSSAPPTDAQLHAAATDGCVAWAGYVPSPGHPDGWAAGDFARVRAAGLVPVFVDLGTPASRIVGAATALGAVAGDIVVTDIEAGGATVQAASAWRAAVADNGFRAGVYGTDSTCDAVGAQFAVSWRARYGVEPTAVPDNTLVQWRNTHDENGAAVDRSAIGEGVFDNMGMSPAERLDVGRALARLAYAAVAHRFPENGAAEDGWAVQGRDASFDAEVERILLTQEFAADLAHDAAELHEPAA